MGSMSVSSYICCMFVSCVHPVAVLNAAFCMTCSLLIFICCTFNRVCLHSFPTDNIAQLRNW